MTTNQTDPGLKELLSFVKETRGFDFKSYKNSTVERRISKRMATVGVGDYTAYLDHLQVHPDEFVELFNTFLINVTSFFRDPDHWAHLEEEVIPEIIRDSGQDHIRVWSAGCSSGPEAYTITMLFAEALGIDAFRDRVKVYATDLDAEALVQARQATYSLREVEAVPKALRSKYFEQQGDRYAFRSDLRRSVIFGRHDLLRDAPIGRLSLLVCRNVLMYFTADSQARMLRNLHFALKDNGYLFLGRAETMLSRSDRFAVSDLRHRVFNRVPVWTDDVQTSLQARAGPRDGVAFTQTDRRARLRDAAFGASSVAQLIVSVDGVVVLANTAARTMFGLTPSSIGQRLSDLELSYRPVELRSRIDAALSNGRAVQTSNVEYRSSPTEMTHLDVWVTPLTAAGHGVLGVAVTFEDITHYERLRRKLHESSQELETAYEELQSANEELETMNEELQSANADQQETNDALTLRGGELDHKNAFLQSILGSLSSAVVVIDHDHTVITWNSSAEGLWGLRSDEVVGRSFFDLDFGLPVERLADPVREVFARGNKTAVDLKAVTRLGKQIMCHIRCGPLYDTQGVARGGVLMMEVAS